MSSKAEEVQERIADLSELMAAAQDNLAALSENGHPRADVLAVNLRATIETVQRELARAKRALDQAQGIDAAEEILAQVKTQAQERNRFGKWDEIRTATRSTLERAAAIDKAGAIMAPLVAAAATKNRNKKKKRTR